MGVRGGGGECSDDFSGYQAYQIMSNVSDTHEVLTSTQNGSEFSFLAPANPPPGLDFRTSTFAIGSSCQPLSPQQCQLGTQPNQIPLFGISPGGFDTNVVFNYSSDLQAHFNVLSDTGLPDIYNG